MGCIIDVNHGTQLQTGTAGLPPATVGQGHLSEDRIATQAGETPAVPVKRLILWGFDWRKKL
jgi:hypothetical protein